MMLLRAATASLAANKLRSVLAVLGIVIGVSAVIMMIAMGKGAEERVAQSVSGLGVNLVFVYPGQRGMGPGHARTAMADTLTLEDAAALERLPYVESIAPDVSRNFQVKYLGRNANVRIVGTTPEYTAVRAFKVENGAFLTRADVIGKRRVCVLGAKVARDLFGGGDPVDHTIQIDRKNFRVLGVMEEKGGGGWINLDEWIYVPVTTAQLRLLKRNTLNQIIVSLDAPEHIDAGMELIDQAMARRHRIGANGEKDYSVGSMTEIRQRMDEMTGAFTLLLSGIAVVSLLVGGIGIMNIMLVSVTERTREIGIRKAVGARNADILRQFLVESVVISLLGGLLGILLGVGGAQLVPRLPVWQMLSGGEWKSVVSMGSVVLSFGFSCAVGVFFGIYPAVKAARMSPVEALR
ncbi:MAG: ABC transporter permease, partial [Planctomycetes bacterium]|nr:ABC transporter permease [Planctomycetota bacterium]